MSDWDKYDLHSQTDYIATTPTFKTKQQQQQKTWGRSPKAPNFKKQEKTTEDAVLRHPTG